MDHESWITRATFFEIAVFPKHYLLNPVASYCNDASSPRVFCKLFWLNTKYELLYLIIYSFCNTDVEVSPGLTQLLNSLRFWPK